MIVAKDISKYLTFLVAVFLLFTTLFACHNKKTLNKKALSPVFHAEGKPKLLSEWQILNINNNQLNLTNRVLAYDLNSSLFSDYAHKLRTIWMPEKVGAKFHATDTFEFPIGTIISKTFYYPNEGVKNHKVLKVAESSKSFADDGLNLAEVKLIETRLLVRRQNGWDAIGYVWNEDETDAVLKRTGDIKQLTLKSDNGSIESFNYVVPNENQCAGCHATNASTREIQPIGPKARHLNKSSSYRSEVVNQLDEWVENKYLNEIPEYSKIAKNVVWNDVSFDINSRARAYLDINCSHCHNAVGPADTSGLLLEPSNHHLPSLGVCKLPIAAGTGTGNREYGIVPGKPDESIFTYRMASTNPAEMMPELGRSLVHEEGVELIHAWIAEMQGACE